MWWIWIPGVAAAIPATLHTLWLRRRFDDEILARANELQREVMDQFTHGLQLWPRPWQSGRPLTQVEEIVTEPYGFKGMPLPPEEQLAKMREDAQRILDSYKRPRDS